MSWIGFLARAGRAGWSGTSVGGWRRWLAAGGAVGLLSCTDRGDSPVGPGAPSAAARARRLTAVAPAPSASVPVTVQVPASMRSAPFDVPRTLTLPPGFTISVFARQPGVRFLAIAPNGDLFVSNPGAHKIHLVRPSPTGGDPTILDWATGLYRPHDIVFHTIGSQTYVYVAEADKVARYTYAPGDLTGQNRQVIVSGLPSNFFPELRGAYGHELKNIALAGDKLYVSIASTCNACLSDTQSDPVRGAIYVYNADGTGGRLFARGLRNAEGLAFAPGGALWVTVNNRDNVPYPHHGDFDGDGGDDYGRVMQAYVDNHPPDEFTRVRDGGNYGWPFCNPNPDTPAGLDDMPFDRDVETNADGSRLDCAAADRISKGIQAHSAPLGLTFLHGTAAPAAFREGALVALHGSWNRATKTGYKMVHFAWDAAAGRPGVQTDFVTGWATATTYWGRPMDAAVAGDGAIYITDDQSGTIYRMAAEAPPPPPPPPSVASLVAESGKCLDVDGGAGQVDGARAQLWACFGNINQRWTLPAAGTTGEIRVWGGKCLDADSGTARDGDRVQVWACNGLPQQRWRLTPAGEVRGVGDKCLDVDAGGTANGTRVQLWTCHGGPNQRWATRP